MVSAYITTCPCSLRAARPMVCISDTSERKKPSLSASSMATRLTSGISRPSRSRLIPTSTSNTSIRMSRMILERSKVSTSECRYFTLIPACLKYSVSSSAIRFVSVVTSTFPAIGFSPVSSGVCPFFISFLISEIRSSICPRAGRTSTSGSRSPVGLITCSVRMSSCSASYCPGVADTNITWSSLSSNSSNFKGLLSSAEGSLKP